MLERAYTLCEDDQIQPHDLRLADAPGASQEGAASLSEIDNLEDYLEDIERKLIMQALEETRWNRTAAAQRLGLTFRSMRYRLKSWASTESEKACPKTGLWFRSSEATSRGVGAGSMIGSRPLMRSASRRHDAGARTSPLR